ncbi:uncharacterized protein [Lolium perenne]|uniref:uncharacterized protein n=1 Tax=Lolium perenne TaxID=4522 RepID=UPI003A9A4554
MAPHVQQYASHLGDDNESDWLHRNEAWQMQAKPGGNRPILVAQSNITGAGSLSQISDLTNNRVCPSQGRPKRTNMSWYARMSEENKAEYLQRQRIAHQQKIDAARSGLDGSQPPTTYIPSSPHTPMSNVTQTPCCESAMGHVSTSANFHGQESFVAKSADPHKRRHQRREKYSLMTDEQREEYLRNNRKYKHCRRESGTLFDHNDTIHVKNSSASSPRTNDAMHAQSSEPDPGETNITDESDPPGIFEPLEQDARFEENTETMQEEETVLDDDEECRIFTGLGDVFDSYRLTTDVPQSEQNDDPYDFVYHNLPKKHHVLKTVPDCIHCGAMKLQYEGPAFCCRKGKVKIATPEVPQELRRLFTSQVDADAKYFRKHIRYFNTHFSFTSLGVTLDKTVDLGENRCVYISCTRGTIL